MTNAFFHSSHDKKRYTGEVVDVEAREVIARPSTPSPAVTVRPFSGSRVTVTPFPLGVKVAPRIISSSVVPVPFVTDLAKATLQVAERDSKNAQAKLDKSTDKLLGAFAEFCDDLAGMVRAERRVHQLKSQIRQNEQAALEDKSAE